ncbi:hypothetical protein ACVBEH_06175 [Roseateles sp. GG27B]
MPLCPGLGLSTLARFETGGVAEFGSRKLLRLLEVMGYEMSFALGRRDFTLDDALAERQSVAASATIRPPSSAAVGGSSAHEAPRLRARQARHHTGASDFKHVLTYHPDALETQFVTDAGAHRVVQLPRAASRLPHEPA